MSVYEKKWRKELKDALETSLGGCLRVFVPSSPIKARR